MKQTNSKTGLSAIFVAFFFCLCNINTKLDSIDIPIVNGQT